MTGAANRMPEVVTISTPALGDPGCLSKGTLVPSAGVTPAMK